MKEMRSQCTPLIFSQKTYVAVRQVPKTGYARYYRLIAELDDLEDNNLFD